MGKAGREMVDDLAERARVGALVLACGLLMMWTARWTTWGELCRFRLLCGASLGALGLTCAAPAAWRAALDALWGRQRVRF